MFLDSVPIQTQGIDTIPIIDHETHHITEIETIHTIETEVIQIIEIRIIHTKDQGIIHIIDQTFKIVPHLQSKTETPETTIGKYI